MATCKMTTSTFSAEPENAQGIRDGWLAQAADDLIDSKRYTGIDATEVWGTMTNVLRDCPHECDAKGETFNNVITGRLKSVASIQEEQLFDVCQFAAVKVELDITWNSSDNDPGACRMEHSGTYIVSSTNEGGCPVGSHCHFRSQFDNPVPGGNLISISLCFRVFPDGTPQCLMAFYSMGSGACGGIYGGTDTPDCESGHTGLGTWLGENANHPLCSSAGAPGGCVGFIRNFERV